MVLFIGQHAHASSEGGEIRAPFIYQQIPVCLKCTFSEATEHVKKVHVVLFIPTKCSKWKFAIYLFNGHLGYLLPAFTGTFPVNGSHLCKWYTWFGNEYHTIHRFCFPFANRKPTSLPGHVNGECPTL